MKEIKLRNNFVLREIHIQQAEVLLGEGGPLILFYELVGKNVPSFARFQVRKHNVQNFACFPMTLSQTSVGA